jgi:hypothetical protein
MRAAMRPVNSARAYHALWRRVDEWLTRDYVTDQQREELAELILRGGR